MNVDFLLTLVLGIGTGYIALGLYQARKRPKEALVLTCQAFMIGGKTAIKTGLGFSVPGWSGYASYTVSEGYEEVLLTPSFRYHGKSIYVTVYVESGNLTTLVVIDDNSTDLGNTDEGLRIIMQAREAVRDMLMTNPIPA